MKTGARGWANPGVRQRAYVDRRFDGYFALTGPVSNQALSQLGAALGMTSVLVGKFSTVFECCFSDANEFE